MAREGNRSMLSQCFKHMCGWADSRGISEHHPLAIKLAYAARKEQIESYRIFDKTGLDL